MCVCVSVCACCVCPCVCVCVCGVYACMCVQFYVCMCVCVCVLCVSVCVCVCGVCVYAYTVLCVYVCLCARVLCVYWGVCVCWCVCVCVCWGVCTCVCMLIRMCVCVSLCTRIHCSRVLIHKNVSFFMIVGFLHSPFRYVMQSTMCILCQCPVIYIRAVYYSCRFSCIHFMAHIYYSMWEITRIQITYASISIEYDLLSNISGWRKTQTTQIKIFKIKSLFSTVVLQEYSFLITDLNSPFQH